MQIIARCRTRQIAFTCSSRRPDRGIQSQMSFANGTRPHTLEPSTLENPRIVEDMRRGYG